MESAARTVDSAERIARRLKLSDLRLLRAVVERGGMAKAARHLNISQPAVSKAIASLEQTLGVRLLDRHPTGIEPTVYGHALLKGGAAVFDELRQSVTQIRFLIDPTAGELRIGCSAPLSVGLISAVIEQLNRKHSGIRFLPVEGDTILLQNRELRQRRIEMVLGRSPVPCAETDMEAEALFNDQLYVTVGVHSRWARRRRLQLADLHNVPWSLPPYDSVVGALIQESFRASGLAVPEPSISTHSIPVHINMLASGHYVGMLPGSMLRFSAKRLGLKALPIRLLHRPSPVAIVTLKNRTLSPLAKLFIEYARELAKPLAAPG
jgi:DNA-binding transcriptional LysR family regulator